MFNSDEKLKALLIDPSESVKTVLGNNLAQTFLTTGELGNGFAVLTDKRVYFKGKCLVRTGKGFSFNIAERTVDLEDVTGTGFVHTKATWALVMTIISLLAVWVTYFLALVPAVLFAVLYRTLSRTVFEISYAGGGIAFDLRWISSQEATDFQRQLVLLKEAKKKE